MEPIDDKTTDLDSIKRKVKKLLALSKSQNENEAAVALEKANQLLASFNISKTQCENYTERKVKATKAYSGWRSMLALNVAWLYSTYTFRDVGNGEFRFFGQEFDAFIAAEMYEYLSKSVERIARQNIRKNAKTKFRNSYKLGIATNIATRIQQIGKACSWSPQRDDTIKAVESYVGELFEIKKKSFKPKTNSAAINKGFSAGHSISLSRQTTGSGGRFLD